jgi:hypothetical protein
MNEEIFTFWKNAHHQHRPGATLGRVPKFLIEPNAPELQNTLVVASLNPAFV